MDVTVGGRHHGGMQSFVVLAAVVVSVVGFVLHLVLPDGDR